MGMKAFLMIIEYLAWDGADRDFHNVDEDANSRYSTVLDQKSGMYNVMDTTSNKSMSSYASQEQADIDAQKRNNNQLRNPSM